MMPSVGAAGLLSLSPLPAHSAASPLALSGPRLAFIISCSTVTPATRLNQTFIESRKRLRVPDPIDDESPKSRRKGTSNKPGPASSNAGLTVQDMNVPATVRDAVLALPPPSFPSLASTLTADKPVICAQTTRASGKGSGGGSPAASNAAVTTVTSEVSSVTITGETTSSVTSVSEEAQGTERMDQAMERAKERCDGLSYKELQKELKARGLSAKGKKDFLQQTLMAALIDEMNIIETGSGPTDPEAAEEPEHKPDMQPITEEATEAEAEPSLQVLRNPSPLFATSAIRAYIRTHSCARVCVGVSRSHRSRAPAR